MHELLWLRALRVEDAAHPVLGEPPDAAGSMDAGPQAGGAAVGFPAGTEMTDVGKLSVKGALATHAFAASAGARSSRRFGPQG
jgi:hypothetical protein